MTRIAAVILAGGGGERLGGANKALLDIGGRRMVDRVLDALAGCAPLLLAIGRLPFTVTGTVPVGDLDSDYAGPLAGVAAAVEALQGSEAELLLSVAVDTPFFPSDFAARALPLAAAPAVVAAYDGQDYPTNALWRLGAIRGLPAELCAGTAPRSLKRLAAGLGAVRLDYAGLVPEDPFRNANTPQDLAFLRRRAGDGRDG